jgi:hypothetical protein
MSMKQQFQRGDRVHTTRQMGFLPLHSSGTIIRSFVHSDLCTVSFDQRAEPRIISRNDLELVATQANVASGEIHYAQASTALGTQR